LQLSSHLWPILGADACAERDQRVHEAEVVERLRSQLAGDASYLVETLSDRVGDPAQGVRRKLGIAVRGPLGLDGHGSECLPNLVVELPRDPQPLGLLCGERGARRLMASALKPVEHGVEGTCHGLALSAARVYSG
jgi:hypothetical protein